MDKVIKSPVPFDVAHIVGFVVAVGIAVAVLRHTPVASKLVKG